MVRFVQMGILCRCGEPDVKCGLHLQKPAAKKPVKRKGAGK